MHQSAVLHLPIHGLTIVYYFLILDRAYNYSESKMILLPIVYEVHCSLYRFNSSLVVCISFTKIKVKIRLHKFVININHGIPAFLTINGTVPLNLRNSANTESSKTLMQPLVMGTL